MKTKNTLLLTILALAALLASGCAPKSSGNGNNSDPIGMPNPASIYCQEQGYELQMFQDANGTYGVCVFPDGSSCEEWAYFRGECEPGKGEMHVTTAEDVGMILPDAPFDPISMMAYALYGSVTSSGVEVPAPSRLVMFQDDLPPIYIIGVTGDLEEQITALRGKPEPGNKANFWGRLECPSLDQCLLTATDMRVDGPGETPLPDQIENWEGVIYSGPDGPRSGGDDYFALLGSLPFQYGLDSTDDALRRQIEQFRDGGQAVRISGLLYAARPDWNGTQLVVTAIEPIEVALGVIPAAPSW